jgi:hypothetical protein
MSEVHQYIILHQNAFIAHSKQQKTKGCDEVKNPLQNHEMERFKTDQKHDFNIDEPTIIHSSLVGSYRSSRSDSTDSGTTETWSSVSDHSKCAVASKSI